MGESEKQKKQRQARQGKRPPVIIPGDPEPAPSWETLPPVFSFPLFEEEKEEVREKPKAVLREIPEIAIPIRKEKVMAKAKLQERVEGERQKALAGIQLDQAVQGIIWSEILQPPRALRPYSSKGTRGRS